MAEAHVRLSRAQIVDAAYSTLRQQGLAGMSMRRLAQNLGVQPGALYHHIGSKQELLAAVAQRILADNAEAICTTDPARAARAIRDALLEVRDSAEVVSFVHAFEPDTLAPLRDLHQLFTPQLPPQQAQWAAQTLIHYVLGFVAEEQNHAELIRAKILTDQPTRAESLDAFLFGVNAIVRGLAAPASKPRSRRR